MHPASSMLPVIIAGAGPCGLLCAVVLQKYNVPFHIVERVEQSRLTSDVGSGFDMAPTAVRIFEHLELPHWRERLTQYAGITMMRMSGDHVRSITTKELPGGDAYAAKRSTLQQILVEKLGDGLVSGDGTYQYGNNAHFGVSVIGYDENEEQNKVTVRLSNGMKLEGSALLACEGWKSATRQQMLGGTDSIGGGDPVNFCKIAMWWGKCEVGPELLKLLEPTQQTDEQENEESSSFCWFVGDGGRPGNFVGALTDDGRTFLWSAAQQCDVDPEQSDDLTIRGGVRGQAVKDELATLVNDQGRCELIRKIISATPAKSVTKVGLYDRENLDQRMVSPGGLVALLGDAGHPQTPFLGQGCNMALADAFAVCTRLGAGSGSNLDHNSLRRALSCLDHPDRKAFAKATVSEARKIAILSTSTSTIMNFVTRKFMQWAPNKYIFPRVDEGNRVFVNQALKECGLAPLPE